MVEDGWIYCRGTCWKEITDDPNALPGFLQEHEMTPRDLIDQLRGMEKRIFAGLYAGSIAKKMYRLYEYQMKKESK